MSPPPGLFQFHQSYTRRFSRWRSLRPVKSKCDVLLDLRVAAFANAAELPQRFKLLAWGDNPTASGRKARVGRKTLSVLNAAQKRSGFEEIALDFEHNTVPGTRAYKESAEPRPVAAYGTLAVVENEGVFFNVSRWTPKGLAEALNFQDLSPAPATDETGEVIFIHSAALCRNGDIEGLRFVTLSVETGNQEKTDMDYKTMLLKLLKLPEDTPDDAIEKAVAAVVEPAAEVAAMTAKVTNLATRIEALSTELQAVKDGDVKRQREAICARAAAEGKVIPLSAEQIEKTEPAVLTDMVSKLAVTVPLHRRTPAVEPMNATGANPAIAQYNAITDADERAKFFNANRAKILGEG